MKGPTKKLLLQAFKLALSTQGGDEDNINKISLIKAYRNLSGEGLKESKEAIDAAVAKGDVIEVIEDKSIEAWRRTQHFRLKGKTPRSPEKPAEGFCNPYARPKVRIIVEMHGGTIQGVYVDNKNVNVTDVVFTESSMYGEEKEFKVEDGPLAGEIIYCHHEPQLGGKDLFGPVMKAAEARAAD